MQQDSNALISSLDVIRIPTLESCAEGHYVIAVDWKRNEHMPGAPPAPWLRLSALWLHAKVSSPVLAYLRHHMLLPTVFVREKKVLKIDAVHHRVITINIIVMMRIHVDMISSRRDIKSADQASLIATLVVGLLLQRKCSVMNSIWWIFGLLTTAKRCARFRSNTHVTR